MLVSARTTLDVDPLVVAVGDASYIDRDAVADAVRRRGMFNVVHLDTMLKVDRASFQTVP